MQSNRYVINRYVYLLLTLAPSRNTSRLETNHSSQQGKGLILGKGDVSIVMETEDLRCIIDWKAANVCQVTLGSKHDIRSHN